jgi:hypothetical protein
MGLVNKSGDRDALTADTTNVAKTTGLAAVLTSIGVPVVSIFTGIEVADRAVRITLIGATAIVLAAAAIAWAIVAAADLRARAAGEAAKSATSGAQGTAVISSLQDAGIAVDRCLGIIENTPNSPSISTVLTEVGSHLAMARKQSGNASSVTECVSMVQSLLHAPLDLSDRRVRQDTRERLKTLKVNILSATVSVTGT